MLNVGDIYGGYTFGYGMHSFIRFYIFYYYYEEDVLLLRLLWVNMKVEYGKYLDSLFLSEYMLI